MWSERSADIKIIKYPTYFKLLLTLSIRNISINLSLYGQLIFDKGGRSIKWSKNSLFNKWVLGELDSYMQKNENRSPTYSIHKNKFKVDKRFKYKS